jgi:L-alanine-DL-glutamate epimerase-like enolase superfamily enzyme
MRVWIDVLEARLRAPFRSAWGSITARELLVLRLEDSDGRVGFGEAAPLAGYDGTSIADVRAAIEDCRTLLEDHDGVDRDALLAACTARGIWDLAGRRAGRPVWHLLGALDAAEVAVNWTIAAGDRAGAAREASQAREAGFSCVKVKVGIGDDAGRLAAVRAVAGPEMAIRIDANGAWSVGEALASLAALEPVGIELCEEPVSGLAGIADVSAQTPVAVAIDETATDAGAFENRVCTAVCLKIGACGGITGLVRAAGRARAVGYEVYLASTLDGPFGIAAALHAAAVIGPDRPCGLATLGLFERGENALTPNAGRIASPSGAGLGDGLVGW